MMWKRDLIVAFWVEKCINWNFDYIGFDNTIEA